MSDLDNPNSLINKIGSSLQSVMEDKHNYDIAKAEFELEKLIHNYDTAKAEFEFEKLIHNFDDNFPEYTTHNLLSSILKGYMRDWGLYHEGTGIFMQPLIEDYIGDTPVDIGVRFSKEIK